MNSKEKSQLIAELQRRLNSSHFNLTALAEQSGLTRPTLYKIKSGEDVSASSTKKLAEYFKIM